MNPLYTEQEIEHQLHDAEARFLLTIPMFLEKASAAAARCGIERIFVFGEAECAEPFSNLMAEEGSAPDVAIDPDEDVAAMLYSSGTTGLPKGVMLTHRNLVAALAQADKLFGDGPATSLLFLPMFHIFGFHAVANYDLLKRGKIVTMPRFDFEQMLSLIATHRIDRVCVVPPIVLALVKSPLVDQYDLSSLKLVFSGAAPLDEALAARTMLVDGGWLRTGDFARRDEYGWLYIVDRAKELIKYKGLQVAPAELEAVLLSHPSIADAAVIGVPDDEAGEVPKAFVVVKEDVTAEQIQEFVASQVAPYKKIRQIEFLDAIPKSPSGKILRRILRDRERAQR